MTLIIPNSKSKIQIYQRHGAADQFEISGTTYQEHSDSIEITALDLQDAGIHAVSGDSEGSLHVWRTDSPDSNVQKKFKTGNVVSVAISRQFILVSFLDDKPRKDVWR